MTKKIALSLKTLLKTTALVADGAPDYLQVLCTVGHSGSHTYLFNHRACTHGLVVKVWGSMES